MNASECTVCGNLIVMMCYITSPWCCLNCEKKDAEDAQDD